MQFAIGLQRMRDPLVVNDSSVAEVNVAVGVSSNVRLVGDDNRGDALAAVEPLENSHYLNAAARIKSSRRFIRENDLRIVHQLACDCDPLLLPTGQLIRAVIGSIRKATKP